MPMAAICYTLHPKPLPIAASVCRAPLQRPCRVCGVAWLTGARWRMAQGNPHPIKKTVNGMLKDKI